MVERRVAMMAEKRAEKRVASMVSLKVVSKA